MVANFHFEHTVSFETASAAETLRAIPALPGVFALHGPSVPGQYEPEPYLTRAADLRRRIARILAPPEPSAKADQPAAKADQSAAGADQSSVDGKPIQSKRLNLRTRVARIEYSVTGSEFESTLTLYHAATAIFGPAEARRRLRLHTPFFLRFTAENAYPRVYSTNRLNRRALAHTYGPFPSRAAADRYCDAVLDLFKLRRCYEDLAPYPEHPGCVYGEMNKCLAPCNQACTPAGAAAYSAEAAAVEAFFSTHGESLLAQLATQRERAAADLDFERAAQLHAQLLRVKAAAALADPLVQPIPKLRAIIVQATAKSARFEAETEAEPTASIFLLASGCITGPARLSTLGVRAVKDQASVGTSLFAQPLIVQAVPLAGSQSDSTQPAIPALTFSDSPALSAEDRAAHLIDTLAARAKPHPKSSADLATLSDHLSLLRRWYYRPEKQRVGEVFFPKADGPFPKADGPFPKEDAADKAAWPIRRILNAAARIALGEPKPTPEAQPQTPQPPAEGVH